MLSSGSMLHDAIEDYRSYRQGQLPRIRSDTFQLKRRRHYQERAVIV